MERLIAIVLAPGVLLIVGAFLPMTAVRRVSRNLLVSYTMIALMLVGGELYFRYGHAQSENVLTKANSNWLNRYWQVNSLGFRDREWAEDDWTGKTTVMLVGDSFAAGWGIEDPTDRFGDVLARNLGDDYALLNVAEYGRSTPEQLDILQNHPLQDPDVVILQYFLNDISFAQLRLGLQLDPGETPWWA
ncbi:MAG: SGNH/GDSL hydrolase family protein, partial [Chloroflexota bacterium]